MKTIRQDIVDRIIALMQTVTITGGYQTDFGTNVNDSKAHYNEEDMPAMSVFDLAADIEFARGDKEATQQKKTLEFQLRFFAAGQTKASELRKMIADANKALGTDQNLGGKVLWINPTQEGLIVDEDTFEVAGAAIRLEIAYKNPTFNDYI